MQLKLSFKKEWLSFRRSFRFGGMLICIFSFVLANPLLYKALIALMGVMEESGANAAAGIQMGEMNILDNATVIFSGTLLELTATSLLVIMLIHMPPFGGEQKNRATIIPACSGLAFKNYLLPKYVLYPAVMFVANFLAGCVGGALCNALFTNEPVGVDMIMLGSLLASIYAVFMLVVYMTLGLCTSRPGLMVIVVYLGQTLIQIILSYLGLTRFNPFTLYNLIAGEMFMEGFSLADEAASITVAVVLSIIICVLMYILSHAVLKAKKINNQENRPEF